MTFTTGTSATSERGSEKHLLITVRPEPGDPACGYRAEAAGDESFLSSFAEYGRTPNEAVGHLIRSLHDGGLLQGPIQLDLGDNTDV